MHIRLFDLNQTNEKWLVITAHVRIAVDIIGSKDTGRCNPSLPNPATSLNKHNTSAPGIHVTNLYFYISICSRLSRI